jgi:hypothetical protein
MSEPNQQSNLDEPAAGLPVSQSNKWDWRVVLLELFIVFVGLFAALQLDSYRDEREFREAQSRHLVRLKEDLEEYLVNTEDVLEFLQYNSRAVSHVSASLQAGKIQDEDIELFEFGVIFFAHLPSNPLPRASYEEMVASGMFSALDSEELKQAISRLFSLHEFMESNFRWWREGALEFEGQMSAFVDHYEDPDLSYELGFLEEEIGRRVRFDFDELANSRVVRNGFYWAQDSVSDWLVFTEFVRTSASDVRNRIEHQLNVGR